MDDTFRLDLSGQDSAFIWEALYGFAENAAKYDVRLVVIRMTTVMFQKLDLDQRGGDPIFEGTSIVIDDSEFEDTIELRYVPLH